MKEATQTSSIFATINHSVILFFVGLLVLAPYSYGDPPSKKTCELETKLENDSEIGTNTMAPALMTAWGGDAVSLPSVSLFTTPFMIGTKGAMQYQMTDDRSYRLRFDSSEGVTSFFMHFDYELDLRNRWVRLSYSGLSAPEKLYVVADRLDENRSDARYPIYLERSAKAHDSYFKLPARLPYGKIKTLDFVIDPKDQTDKWGEFTLFDMQVMPQQYDPLKGESFKSIRMPSFSESLKTDPLAALAG